MTSLEELSLRRQIEAEYEAQIEAAIRERDEARAALQWFVDREAPIQHKFNLHGPEDTAVAMKAAFRAGRAALQQSEAKP